MSDVSYVNRQPRFGQIPKEVLDLVFAVLISQRLDELVKPPLGVLGEQASGVAQVGIVGVEDVGSEQTAQVDNDLLVGRHKPFGHGADHLI